MSVKNSAPGHLISVINTHYYTMDGESNLGTMLTIENVILGIIINF